MTDISPCQCTLYSTLHMVAFHTHVEDCKHQQATAKDETT